MYRLLRCKRSGSVQNTTTGVIGDTAQTTLWAGYFQLVPVFDKRAKLRETGADVDIVGSFAITTRQTSLDVEEGDRLYDVVSGVEPGTFVRVLAVVRWKNSMEILLSQVIE